MSAATANSVAARLSPLGFGAAPIGNLYREISQAEAEAALLAALDSEINFFDTAPFYGFGLSEKRLGKVLSIQKSVNQREIKQKKADLVISTKVGRCLKSIENIDGSLRHGFASKERYEPYFDYSYDGVMRTFESSLQRLQVEKVDIIFAHDLGEVTHGKNNTTHLKAFYEGGYKAMLELKKAGRVAAVGIGVNECEACVEINREVELDCILLAGRYSLLDQSAAEKVFPLCAKKNTTVILGGVFNSGILASGVSDSRARHYYNYAPASAEIKIKVAKIEKRCQEYAIPLTAAALQFPWLNKQVASVLVGLASADQVKQALQYRALNIPWEFWQTLKKDKLIPEYIEMQEGAA